MATGRIPINGTAAIQETIVDAKGDLIVGTGADAVARLAVGTNGHTLVADSGAATGLAYSAGIPVVLNAQTATYTVVLGDAYKLVTMSVASANDFSDLTSDNRASNPRSTSCLTTLASSLAADSPESAELNRALAEAISFLF